MLKIHRTKEGEKMFISQMEDSHLQATINLFIKKIKDLKDALSMKVNVSPFKSALYAIDSTEIAENAKQRISTATSLLYPYLAEAMLRGMDYTVELQELFERTGKEDRFSIEDGSNLLEFQDDEED